MLLYRRKEAFAHFQLAVGIYREVFRASFKRLLRLLPRYAKGSERVRVNLG